MSLRRQKLQEERFEFNMKKDTVTIGITQKNGMSSVCGKFLVTGSTNALQSSIRRFISNLYMDLQEEGQLNYIKAPGIVSEIGDIQQVLCLSFLFPYYGIELIYTRQQPFEQYSASHLPCIYEDSTQIEGLLTPDSELPIHIFGCFKNMHGIRRFQSPGIKL